MRVEGGPCLLALLGHPSLCKELGRGSTHTEGGKELRPGLHPGSHWPADTVSSQHIALPLQDS